MTKSSKESVSGTDFLTNIPAPRVDWIPDAVEPFVKLGLKFQGDFFELAGHRAQAWANWPKRAMACRCLADLTSAQTEYVTAMQCDYARFMDECLKDALIEQEDLGEDAQASGPVKNNREAA